MTRIPFGINENGRLIDATFADRGLACNCICPECRQPLIAKKGSERIPHFAHSALGHCAGGAETALHLAAKQIVVDHRRLNLPAIPVSISKKDSTFGLFQLDDSFEADAEWRFETIDSEVAIGSLHADVAGEETRNGFVAVEIFVRHAVEETKAKILSDHRVPCIEINLSALIGKMLAMDELTKHVLSRTDNKRWIYHPRESHYKQILVDRFSEWQRAKEHQRNQQIEMQQRANLLFEAKKSAARRKIEDVLGPMREERWPRHIGVQLKDGMGAFSAPLDLWQGLLFCEFVAKSREGRRVGHTLPPTGQIVRDLADQIGTSLRMHTTRQAELAVRLYLGYLRQCGFLETNGGGYVVVHDGLDPPRRRTGDAPSRQRYPSPTRPHVNLWRPVWPERENILRWAEQHAASKMTADFNAPEFVYALLSCKDEPDEQEMREMINYFGGAPSDLPALLSAMGVSANSFRVLSCGDPPPWATGY